ncbi:MAG TPA: superoxide dismutase [Polyangia bacterium]|nr:superoxide dismutase [Polyangia bacterium]
MGQFTLPDLRYDYGALEPHLDGRIVQLHHDKHHRAYVDGANQALERLAECRRQNDFGKIAALERALAFNLSGHVLHSIYWRNLSPDGGGPPSGELAAMIDRDFGSFAAFRGQMIEAAMTTMGSGWAALAWEPLSRRLVALELHDHQSSTTQGSVPLLVLDAWEHAYYLQYQTDKKKYFEAIWNLWDWDDVTARLRAATRLELDLEQVAEAPGGEANP